MNVKLSRAAEKQFDRINEPMASRIMEAVKKLEKDPPQGDIKKLKGQDGYRVRVGNYRILFGIVDNFIIIEEINPRGQAYK